MTASSILTDVQVNLEKINSAFFNFPFPTVDTTAQDPASGSFSVPAEGLWRFTMTAGDVGIPNQYGGSGYLNLKVDGTTVALSHTYTEQTGMGKKMGHRLHDSVFWLPMVAGAS